MQLTFFIFLLKIREILWNYEKYLGRVMTKNVLAQKLDNRYQVSFYLWRLGSVLRQCKVPNLYDKVCNVYFTTPDLVFLTHDDKLILLLAPIWFANVFLLGKHFYKSFAFFWEGEYKKVLHLHIIFTLAIRL